MDFIPLPDGVSSHEPVPELRGFDYDNKGFIGYDQREGWNVQALRQGWPGKGQADWFKYGYKMESKGDADNLVKTMDQVSKLQAFAASFVQTWILYGLFQEALKRKIQRREIAFEAVAVDEKADFIKTRFLGAVLSKLTNQRISSRPRFISLQPLFEEFLEKLTDIAVDPPRAVHFLHCVREAGFLLSDLDHAAEAGYPMILPPYVHQALAVLVRSFDDYMRVLIPFESASIIDNKPFLIHDKQLITRLKERRWCPCLVERIRVGLGIAGLYYASLLPMPGNEHHDHCTTSICVAANIDQRNYNIYHVPRNCLCLEIGCDHKQGTCHCLQVPFPESELQTAFLDDGFPLVRVRLFEDQIDIVRYSPGMRYVALSHVWSDGRGNPLENAMPICQLRELEEYVFKLKVDSDTLFWIDTLCVPVKEPLRNTAIMRMAKIYQSAARVLVLSAELSAIKLPSTLDEIFLRIFCSTWNTRLWTLQEAVLSRVLSFQFSDQSIRFDHLQEAIDHMIANSIDKSHMIAQYASHWLVEARKISSSDSGEVTIERYCSALRFRSTSRPSDVAICGSILLGSGLAQVLAVPNAAKMLAFWRCRNSIPVGVLFSTGPRLKIDGFRWAPSNLLETGTTWAFGQNPVADITPDGLSFQGIKGIQIGDFFVPADEAGKLYRLKVLETEQRYLIMLRNGKEKLAEVKDAWTGSCVLLLEELPDHHSQTSAALVMPLNPVQTENNSNITTQISAQYLGKVHVFCEGGAYANQKMRTAPKEVHDFNDWAKFYRDRPHLQMFVDVTETRRLLPSQRWRIC